VASDCVLRCTCCKEWEVEAVTLHQPPARPKSFLRIRHLGYVDREYSRLSDAEAFLKRKGLLGHLDGSGGLIWPHCDGLIWLRRGLLGVGA